MDLEALEATVTALSSMLYYGILNRMDVSDWRGPAKIRDNLEKALDCINAAEEQIQQMGQEP